MQDRDYKGRNRWEKEEDEREKDEDEREKEEDEREKDEDERDDDAARLQSVISLLLHSRKCSFLNLDLTTIPAYKIHGESILSTMMSTIRDSMGLVLRLRECIVWGFGVQWPQV